MSVELKKDTLISHYKILEKIGAGGMGVVYKAEDIKLKRTVALKFLPPEFTRDKDSKDRFVHEARTSAILDHPNICTVHEIRETDDGQMFMAMAYYQGETLNDKISSRPLPIAEAIDIAIQVAEGLHEAHAKKIIHRDIKSANIIITENGQVKILDFGLAKLKGQTRLTKEGTTLGTVAYMSPEQASGEKVDHRSDIWSLGVVLYEMLTGQIPFRGEYDQAIMYAVMNEEQEPITGLRTGVPLELERILNKTLAKDPRERYQTTADLLVDLRKIQKESKPEVKPDKKVLKHKGLKKPSRKLIIIGSFMLTVFCVVSAILVFKGISRKGTGKTEETKQLRKIAVLPFEDMSPQKDQEWFCNGISEELINRLAKISAFQVTARTSAFSFKGKSLDIPAIGKRLNVDTIVEGSVRKAGNKLRITAQLIKVADGYHIWSETYDRSLEDVFAIQDQISLSIAEKLKVSLLREESAELKSRPTKNLAAYNLYLRASSYYINHSGEKGSRTAAQMIEKAITLDPNFALAYTKLSFLYSWIYLWDRDDATLAKAKDAVNKAFKINPNLPEAYVALGYYYSWGYFDYGRALEQFKIAQKSLKNNADLLAGIGSVQKRLGKLEQSILNFKRALEINPLDHGLVGGLGLNYQQLRRYKEAEETFNLGISMVPDKFGFYLMKINLYLLWHGSTEKAFQVLEEAPEVIHSLPSDALVKLYIYDGNFQKALKLTTFFGPGAGKELGLAWIHGLMKQKDLEKKHYNSAREILEKRIGEKNKKHWPAMSHANLGIAYAGLGRKEEAIRQGKRAVELAPITKDWFGHPIFLQNLAEIYVMVGEFDLAIDQLEFLLSIPSGISVPLLRIDPTWNPLRNNPRFQKLIE
jgi:non-specific serine/threonine protein kinase